MGYDLTVGEVRYLMSKAILEAKNSKYEVPVGVVIFDHSNSAIVSKAHNLVEKYKNRLLHAEIVAINKVYRKNKNKYCLDNCSIFCTLEPCLGCFGFILGCRFKNLYFSLNDYESGFISNKGAIGKLKIYSGVLENETSILMKEFFKNIRMNKFN